MDPLAMPGPQFLGLYVPLLAAAIATALILRWVLRRPGHDPGDEPGALAPYEVAYLSGGERRVAEAALASLVQGGALAVSPSDRTLHAAGPPPAGLHPVERAVAQAMKGGAESRTIAEARRLPAGAVAKLRDRLIGLGLLVDDWPAWEARWLPAAPMLLVLLLGLAKIQVGVSRHRPVAILALLCAVAAVVGLVLLAKVPHRSRRGDRVLARLRLRNRALGLTGSRRAADLERGDLALAVGLFGSGILVGGRLDDLRAALLPPSSSSGCGGGCGGGGCGGGCGGCGGCGG